MSKKVLKEYIEFKKISVTTKAKLDDIERYVQLFLTSVGKDVKDINEKDLIDFLNTLPSKFSIATINGIKAYLKNFIKWKYEDFSKRFRNLDKLCRSQKSPSPYTPEDMLTEKEFLKLVEGEKELFWKTLWSVYFYGGFRPSEVISLKWDNVFFESKGTIIKLDCSKNQKQFYKSIPKQVTHILKEWKKYNNSDWVFPSPQNPEKHIFKKSLNWKMNKLSKEVLGKHITLYQLRHSIATIKYNTDIKDNIIAEQMGHNKSMRETYVQLDSESKKANVRKIWAEVEELPQDEREEFEKRIKTLEEQMKKAQEFFEATLGKRGWVTA